VDNPDSDSDDWCVPLPRVADEFASAAASGKCRVVENSRGARRVDINAVQCLGVVKSKGARSGGPGQSWKDDMKKGHAVNTEWGPCILKARCVGGWNCNFRDGNPGGWFVESQDMTR
jgi:hypothetical protein